MLICLDLFFFTFISNTNNSIYKYLVSSQFSLLFVVVCLSFDLYGGGCLSWALPIKLFTIGQHNQHYHLPAKWKWNHISKKKEAICGYYMGPKYQNMYTKHKTIYNEVLKLPKTFAWNNLWQLSSKVLSTGCCSLSKSV